jgi:Amt family ammonium transporter
MKHKIGYDDSLDVFGIHGVSGIVGAIGLTFFLRPGAGCGVFLEQLKYQVEGVIASIVYVGIATFVVLVLVEKTFGLRLPVAQQKAGLDHSQHGEHGYGLTNLS